MTTPPDDLREDRRLRRALSEERLYRDYGQPEVERLARAIVTARGADSDELTPESGYANAQMVPLWWLHQDFALNFLACQKATTG
jgi:hypothetical protein